MQASCVLLAFQVTSVILFLLRHAKLKMINPMSLSIFFFFLPLWGGAGPLIRSEI